MTNENTGDLVEPEGVNAGSAAATEESAHVPAEGDVLGGGDPDGLEESLPDTEDNRDLTGTAPGTDPREPGFEHGSSGQDAAR